MQVTAAAANGDRRDLLLELGECSVSDLAVALGARPWLGAVPLQSLDDVQPGCVLGLDGPALMAPPSLLHSLTGGGRVPQLVVGPAGAVALGAPVCAGDVLDVDGQLFVYEPVPGPVSGSNEVNRPPRLLPGTSSTTVPDLAEPLAPEPRPLAVLPLVIPVALGVVMALVTSPLFLLFTLMSPLMLLATWWTERRRHRRRARDLQAEHAAAVTDQRAELTRLVGLEAAARHDALPSPDALLGQALSAGPRLWERRRADADFLVLRVGHGPAPATSIRASPAPVLSDAPLGLPVRELGVIGLAGDRDLVRALTRSLVGQAASLHSPRDLAVWLLVDPLRPHDWDWFRWLPHAAGKVTPVLVGDTAATVTARIAELNALLGAPPSRDVLLVLDGAQALRSLPGLAAVLRDGPSRGIQVLCLDDSPGQLPEECAATLTVRGTQVELRRAGAAPAVATSDLVSTSWAEAIARALAPRTLADPAAEATELVSAARLLDLLDLGAPTVQRVRARWGRTTSAVLGVDADGPFSIDLARDGPHVLVAGTTGSGKSELLQTLVASLAVANRPDAMSFVLVDYKGGAAFKECARLPHTVGMVTDLDGHLVERALASLTAELTARERLLLASGSRDIEEHWRSGQALARLVLVIDEFASLVEELPDFVRGLVGIAQRGRSLGVHLVLATQRPSGVVSPEIRANTNLRIALRVTDASESLDVLDVPDAAGLRPDAPGRALARSGQGRLRTFQTARIGGHRPGITDTEPVVRDLPWAAVGLPLPLVRTTVPEDDRTDLHLLVEGLRAAAEGLPSPRRPWLPPLPPVLVLDPAPLPRLVIPYGVEDLPQEQDQRPAVLDLARGGHLLVAGASRSGRSTFLRTFAGSLAERCSVEDVHLYALDGGNGALLPLAGLPHTGAVVTRAQGERAGRLVTRLEHEVTRRQELLASHGWAELGEMRVASSDPRPYLVLLIDRWEGLAADDLVTDALLRLLREGPAAGLRVVITGDRSVLVGKASQLIEETLLLRLADRSDYTLAGLSPRALPEALGDGRAVRADSGREVQVALLCDDPSGAAQTAALSAIARRAQAAAVSTTPSPQRIPFRVDELPSRLSVTDADQLPAVGLAIAVGGDELHRVGPQPGCSAFTVAGPPRSGRSTALLVLARSLLAAGTTVHVVTPRPSPVRELAGVRPFDGLEALQGPSAVLVDDAELIEGTAMAELLSRVVREGRDQQHALYVAGSTDHLSGVFRGFTVEARKSRSGLLLGLTSHLDGDLLGVRLPRSAVTRGPIGRGLLVLDGEVTTVQVPHP